MAVDHVGLVFFPEEVFWRLVGRFSFPVFALLVAVGLVYTRDKMRYGRRLFFCALISEIPQILMCGKFPGTINCVFGFSLAVGLVVLWEHKKRDHAFALAAACIFLPIGYFGFSSLWVVLLFLLLRPVISVDRPVIKKPPRRLMPRWFFYWFYPLHMFALGVLRFFA